MRLRRSFSTVALLLSGCVPSIFSDYDECEPREVEDAWCEADKEIDFSVAKHLQGIWSEEFNEQGEPEGYTVQFDDDGRPLFFDFRSSYDSWTEYEFGCEPKSYPLVIDQPNVEATYDFPTGGLVGGDYLVLRDSEVAKNRIGLLYEKGTKRCSDDPDEIRIDFELLESGYLSVKIRRFGAQPDVLLSRNEL